MKTPEQVRELWVQALESGKYKQCRLNLKNKDGKFCCLGVLCDLYIQETGNENWEENTLSGNYKFKDNDSSLPYIVRMGICPMVIVF